MNIAATRLSAQVGKLPVKYGICRALRAIALDFMRSPSTKLIWLFLVLAGAVISVFVLSAGLGRNRAVKIQVARPIRKNLISWTSSNGKVEPIEPRTIQSPLTTRIENVAVKEGQTVRAGDELFRLDVAESKGDLAHMKEQLFAAQDERQLGLNGGPPAEIAQLESDLMRANADIARLRREGDALHRLYEKQAATRLEVEQNQSALEKAEIDKHLIEQKRNALIERSKVQAERAALRIDEARNSIQFLEQKVHSQRLTSPIAGTIYSLLVRTPAFTHEGDILAEVADLRRVRVRIFVDEADLGSLKPGQSIEITWDALPDRVWSGIVQQLPKTIVLRGSRSVGEVLCSVENEPAELLPNTNVNVRIRSAERHNALTIPRAAVYSEGGNPYVFLIHYGRLRKHDVRVGISNLADYELVDGINDNDLVALQGAADLHEGLLVSVPEFK
jgi:HlyD family secretion protein